MQQHELSQYFQEHTTINTQIFSISQFVPNYSHLSETLKKQIANIIADISICEDKKIIQRYNRRSILEEVPLLRAHLWKLSLGTLPLKSNEWKNTKISNQKSYRHLLNKFFKGYLDEENLLDISQTKFIDEQLWHEVTLDTKRTHSGLNFFQREVDVAKIFVSKPTRNYDIMSRILYIWAKTSPTVRYVQGMNEILAPLYYLQFQYPNQFSESQVFFMFCSSITFVIDMHIKQMDTYEHGIMGRMNTLNKYLKVIDLELWSKMEQLGILPQYYAFRWLALLLSQQFGLYETMKLWDHFFSFDEYRRFFFVYCCCLAILKIRKKFIMNNQFILSLPCLQKLRDVDVDKVIQIAYKIYQKYGKYNMDKLYEQKQLQNEKTKQPEPAGWSYSDIVKSTGNYLSKWYNNNSSNKQSK